MSSIDKLEPANKTDVGVYLPYYAKDKHNILPYAITLYQQGFFEGQRKIEASDDIAFVASWFISKLPSELTRCRLQFDGQAELSYEVTISNAEFIDCLIDIIKSFRTSGSRDFPQGFYRKLLRFDD